jgi:hypothetical protein
MDKITLRKYNYQYRLLIRRVVGPIEENFGDWAVGDGFPDYTDQFNALSEIMLQRARIEEVPENP